MVYGCHPNSGPPEKKGSCFQPPDAENRMSGGVGGVTGIIPSPRPDQSGFTL